MRRCARRATSRSRSVGLVSPSTCAGMLITSGAIGLADPLNALARSFIRIIRSSRNIRKRCGQADTGCPWPAADIAVVALRQGMQEAPRPGRSKVPSVAVRDAARRGSGRLPVQRAIGPTRGAGRWPPWSRGRRPSRRSGSGWVRSRARFLAALGVAGAGLRAGSAGSGDRHAVTRSSRRRRRAVRSVLLTGRSVRPRLRTGSRRGPSSRRPCPGGSLRGAGQGRPGRHRRRSPSSTRPGSVRPRRPLTSSSRTDIWTPGGPGSTNRKPPRSVAA